VLSQPNVAFDLHQKSTRTFERAPNERGDFRLVIDQQDLFQEGHRSAAYQASDMPAGWSRHALVPQEEAQQFFRAA
jgi:hypothetical protein